MPYRGPTDDEAKESIRQWMREYLRRTGTTQAQLADDLGVSEPTVSNILKGHVKPGFKTLVRLHFGLGVEPREALRFRPPASTRQKASP